jgi:hypothetical protein
MTNPAEYCTEGYDAERAALSMVVVVVVVVVHILCFHPFSYST